MHGFTIELLYDISLLKTGLVRRAARRHVSYQRTLSWRHVKGFSKSGRHLLYGNAKITTNDFAMFENRLHHVARHVDGNGESDPLIAAAFAGQYCGIDADQLAAGIDQRSAGISGVD